MGMTRRWIRDAAVAVLAAAALAAAAAAGSSHRTPVTSTPGPPASRVSASPPLAPAAGSLGWHLLP